MPWQLRLIFVFDWFEFVQLEVDLFQCGQIGCAKIAPIGDLGNTTQNAFIEGDSRGNTLQTVDFCQGLGIGANTDTVNGQTLLRGGLGCNDRIFEPRRI